MTQRVGAARRVEILNSYFDEVPRIVGAHNGIVTQFQGDGVLPRSTCRAFQAAGNPGLRGMPRLRGGKRRCALALIPAF